MNETRSPVRNPVAVLREEFDDWAVLFNPDTAKAVGINPMGVVIWKLINGERSVEDLVKEIGQQYEDVPDNVREEVEKFMMELVEGGFIGYVVEVD
jgi:SynChlorMet cassette protein ScmD